MVASYFPSRTTEKGTQPLEEGTDWEGPGNVPGPQTLKVRND